MSFKIPCGNEAALLAPGFSLTFDEVHAATARLALALQESVDQRPRRVVACIRDDVSALLALLTVPELTDYMPINPALPVNELTRFVAGSGADTALLSREFMSKFAPALKAHVETIICLDDILDVKAVPAVHPEVPAWPFGTGRLILHTSGTTGRPKRVPIAIPAMNASAQNIANALDLASDDVALNTLPLFHIGALVDVLLAPFQARGAVAVTDKRDALGIAADIERYRPTWVQLVPAILRHLVDTLDPGQIREIRQSMRFIRSISAPLPRGLQDKAEDLFQCPIIEMYGMTETAGQICTNGRPPASRRPGSVGRPGGIAIQLVDSVGNPVSGRKTGEIVVAGPTVFEGYEGVDKSTLFLDEWFRTGDLGELDDDGYLFIRGRLKEMINVGGEKVSPFEIEEVAVGYPGIREAAAYALPHGSLGEQAGLTIAADPAFDLEGLKAFLGQNLAAFKCPHSIRRLDNLPRLPNAKIDRLLLKKQGLEGLPAMVPGLDAAQIRPAGDLARKISAVWVEALQTRAPDHEDDFFEVGGDSLSATTFLLALEKEIGRTISPNQLYETPTFGALEQALRAEQAGKAEKPGNRPKSVEFISKQMIGWPGQAAVPDGLLRGLGTLKRSQPLYWSCQDAREAEGIVTSLGKRRPLYVVRSLYRYLNRVDKDFADVADQIASEIELLQPAGRIALGGFCGGAQTMHHVAELLQQRGREIQLFIALDYWIDKPVTFPAVYGFSKVTPRSAPTNFHRPDLALPALHTAGAQAFQLDCGHLDLSHRLGSRLAGLENALRDGQVPWDGDFPQHEAWDLDQRLRTPKARIKIVGRSRFYRPGEKQGLKIEISNTSDQAWPDTPRSGLSVVVRLRNLDLAFRSKLAGYAGLDEAMAPGQTCPLSIDIQYPDIRLPLILEILLCSQGIVYHGSRYAGRTFRAVLPAFSRGGNA